MIAGVPWWVIGEGAIGGFAITTVSIGLAEAWRRWRA